MNLSSKLRFIPILVSGLAGITACAEDSGLGASRAKEEETNEEAKSDAADYEREGSTYDSTPSPTSGLKKMRFMPNAIFSGFDGTHDYRAPIAVYDADSDLEITSSDPSAVTIVKTALVNPSVEGSTDNGSYFLITTKKASTFTLTASSKGRKATAEVHVTAYEAAQWAAGEARYKSGAGGDPPCTRCHVDGRAIDHSPAIMSGAKDSEVALIITTGIKPGPTPIKNVDCGDCSEGGQHHRWSITDEEEKAGLVAYLRSLELRGFK